MTSYSMIAALDKLERLRADLFFAIREAVAKSGHCKSYEGTFSVVFPNAFEEEGRDAWGLGLDCYVIGPSRHYVWRGATLKECVDQADEEVREWMAEYD